MKVRAMKYNQALDLVAAALDQCQKGRTEQAAKLFVRASQLSSASAAIQVIHASNSAALAAAGYRIRASEGTDELTDDDIETLLATDDVTIGDAVNANEDEDVTASADDDEDDEDDEIETEFSEDDDEEIEDDGDEEEEEDDEDEETKVFASRLRQLAAAPQRPARRGRK